MSGFGLIRGDAVRIPLADESVDAVITSPPYFALRSYQDDGAHYDGQIGSEPTPADFLAALWAVTDELWRVLKPSGSCWINLGDKYAGSGGHNNSGVARQNSARYCPVCDQPVSRMTCPSCGCTNLTVDSAATRRNAPDRYNQSTDVPAKSLMGLPWRYALGCICPDTYRPGGGPQWTLRAEVVWSKPNGLPESVTDRVRRSHEQWFHLTKQGRYFAAVDEVREAVSQPWRSTGGIETGSGRRAMQDDATNGLFSGERVREYNPLGKLPGSVWAIPSEPLVVPDDIGVDHFACVDAGTEILTTRGWLTHDQLAEGDTVAGYDTGTRRARWTTCSAVHRYDYDGEMVAVDKRGLSMRLTPNHRVIVEKTTRQGHLRIVRADQLVPAHAIPQAAEWDDFGHESIGVDLAALLGWVTAEGWLAGDRVRLCQSVTANAAKVDDIDALLGRIDLPMPDRSKRKKYRRVLDVIKRTTTVSEWRGRPSEMVTWALPLGLSQRVLHLAPGKKLGWHLLMLPVNERRALLDAFIDGDGHRREDGRLSIYQKLRQNLDVLQAVAVTLGYRTRLTQEDGRFVLYLTTDQCVTLRGTNGTSDDIPREHYAGTVWCPSTGTGTFIARRNGKVFITGNSFPQEWPRRIILGWSPSGICVKCGEPRRPVVDRNFIKRSDTGTGLRNDLRRDDGTGFRADLTGMPTGSIEATITGYACACDVSIAPTRPAVILDPFVGTGTVPMVARALGRFGVGLDLSRDYLRLATWRITSGHAAKAINRTNRERQGELF